MRGEIRATQERVMSRVHRALALQTGMLLVVLVGALLAVGGG